MAGKYSYTITRRNNRTESEAVQYLLGENKQFIALDAIGRKKVIEIFKIEKTFSRAFDIVLFEGKGKKIISESNKIRMILVELKTTKKKLVNNPRGFFFGATENEFKLAKKLGNRYRFCFVSLHPESRSSKLLTLSELEKIIRTKRTQYQINL